MLQEERRAMKADLLVLLVPTVAVLGVLLAANIGRAPSFDIPSQTEYPRPASEDVLELWVRASELYLQ